MASPEEESERGRREGGDEDEPDVAELLPPRRQGHAQREREDPAPVDDEHGKERRQVHHDLEAHARDPE